jgi:hypothetical protein
MEPNPMRDALLVYVECLAVGKFAKRRWNGPVIDTSVYDFNDSDVPSCPAELSERTLGCLWDYSDDRTTLPKAVISRQVLSTLRQWWLSLRSAQHSA